MRTTVTLTPETEELIRRLMTERGLSFNDAVNEAIVRGLARPRHRVDTPTFDSDFVRFDGVRWMSLSDEDAEDGLRPPAAPQRGSTDSIAAMTSGSSGFVRGEKRNARPSGATTNFSKFQVIRPALPDASGTWVSCS